MTWSIHGENCIVIRPALHDVSQTNEKNTPHIWFVLQRKIFGTKFGSFCTIQKRFDQNWITNSIAVRVYFWALFANLDFPNSLLAPLCNVLAFCLPVNVYILPICIVAGALSMHYGKVSMGGVTFAFHWEFSTLPLIFSASKYFR